MAIISSLLKVERVVFVGLRRRAANQSVKDDRIVLDTRTVFVLFF